MKKTALILILFIGILNSYSQNVLITQLSATPSTGGINVSVKTIAGNGYGYLSNTYTITGNVIDLSVCYWFDNTLPILQFDNVIFVPLTSDGNYTVNVQIKLSTSIETCNNYATTDNKTTNVSYLSTNNFEQFKNDFTIYPNPTDGKVELKGLESTINQVDIFDNVGRLVKQIKNIPGNSLDLTELSNGVYIVKIQTNNEKLSQKMVIKK